MYTKKVIEYFTHPKNVGEIKNADGVGTVGNIACGDMMTLFIKVKNNKIADIKFKTFGCAAAIATSSMITEMAKNKTVEEAMKIGKGDVADELGGLPPIKQHCSNLAAESLHEAIYDYMKKNKKKIPKELEEEHKRLKKHLDIVEHRM